MSNPNEIAEVLEKGAEVLETAGWCRRTFKNGAGHYCAVGAIERVAPLHVDPKRATFAVEAELGLGRFDLAIWNDRQRDRRKVVRALRRTARKVRQGLITV